MGLYIMTEPKPLAFQKYSTNESLIFHCYRPNHSHKSEAQTLQKTKITLVVNLGLHHPENHNTCFLTKFLLKQHYHTYENYALI